MPPTTTYGATAWSPTGVTYQTWGGGATSPFAPAPGGLTSTSSRNSTTTNTPVSGLNGPFAALKQPLATAATDTLAGGKAVYNTGMDPQNALRDREAQRVQDQARVNAAARGITSSPYGAGLENQAMTNFGIDWQNNQLNRQVTGLGALRESMGPATTLFNSQYGGTSTTNEQSSDTRPPPQYAPQGGGYSTGGMSGGYNGMYPTMPSFSAPAAYPGMDMGYNQPPAAPVAPQSRPYLDSTPISNYTPPRTDYNSMSYGATADNNLSGFGYSTGTAPTTYDYVASQAPSMDLNLSGFGYNTGTAPTTYGPSSWEDLYNMDWSV